MPSTQYIAGLAEHATGLNLPSTRGVNNTYKEPYRLYNLDVFEYELNESMALYGSVPMTLTQSEIGATGSMLLNGAEMWIDVERAESGSLMTHWMVETGPIDLFLWVGRTLSDVHSMYMQLSGFPSLPSLPSLGYHQCRWNYNDQEDVASVDQGFDTHEIPYDFIWLDIEHTEGKRYFTWDSVKFPDPKPMIEGLGAKGRNLVTIVDPHIKKDQEYSVSADAARFGYFVKSASADPSVPNTDDYTGWCWPGDSNWIDFFNPQARKWWQSLFSFTRHIGSTPNLFTWNDMNEPSVFTGPEITMPKDARHFGDVEHRVVHNVYGQLQHRSTHEGQLFRSQESIGETSTAQILKQLDRPFVLSRAFFVGTQRWGAVWTGDNFAQWSHLAASQPMLLNLGISGIIFGGADVGGFFGNPDVELLVRWYEAGSLQPFFRGHAHIDTRRREPWLFGEETTNQIRLAIQRRYMLMPYLYTIFRESWRSGSIVMQPYIYAFPYDVKGWTIEDCHLIGSDLLVAPVLASGQVERTVYLPKAQAKGLHAGLWYFLGNDLSSALPEPMSGGNSVTVSAPLGVLPLWARGGSAIFTRLRSRRSTLASRTDPLALTVYLDNDGDSSGHIVIDDGVSLAYLAGAASEIRITASKFKNIAVNVGKPSSPLPQLVRVNNSPPTQLRTIVDDDNVIEEFKAKFSHLRVERLTVVFPSKEKVPSSMIVVVTADDGTTTQTEMKPLSPLVYTLKEPGIQLSRSTWKLSFK
jgi:alpha 1,3-glucosidase